MTTQILVSSTCTPMPLVFGAIFADFYAPQQSRKHVNWQRILRRHVAGELSAGRR